jgi:hypothetical protein
MATVIIMAMIAPEWVPMQQEVSERAPGKSGAGARTKPAQGPSLGERAKECSRSQPVPWYWRPGERRTRTPAVHITCCISWQEEYTLRCPIPLLRSAMRAVTCPRTGPSSRA